MPKLSQCALFSIIVAGFLTYSTFTRAEEVNAQLAGQQTIVINNGTEVTSLDPHKVEGVAESNVILNLLEGLVSTDANGEVIPAVAERWENNNYLNWKFYLRDGVRWSDNTPVTAHDFVYSWQRLANPQTASPYASYLQYAKLKNIDLIIKGKLSPQKLGVKALNDKVLQVTLSEPVPYFVSMLAHTAMKPVNRNVIAHFGDNWTQKHFVGNGAYLLKEWVVNERIVLKRNPTYWNNANTIIDEATFLPITSENSDINRFRSGEVDITNSAIPPMLFTKLKQEIPEQLHVSPYLCTFYYEINNQREPFTDPRVRTALKLTLDREIIADKIMKQGQIPAYGFTPTFIHGGNFVAPEWASWAREKRHQYARELLAKAGYDVNKPLKFSLLYNTSDQNKYQAIVAASMWKKNLNAQVTLQNQEWKTSLQSRHQGDYDIARATWCGDYNEPSSFLNMLLSTSSNNTLFFKNPSFDDLMSKALRASNEERPTIYQQAEKLLDTESVLIPVYYRVSARLIKPKVGGFSGHDPLDYIDLKNLYIIKNK